MEHGLAISTRESILETVVSALFSLLLLALYLEPELLAIYQRGGNPIPMLITSRAKGLLAGFFLLSVGTLALNVVKLIRKEWSKPLLWVSCLGELAGSFYFAFFMTRWDALASEFIRFFRNDLATWAIIAKAAVLCYLLLTIISIADDLYKVYRHNWRA
ncbi:MAG TPA: hypothetical protein VJ854_03735 [Sphaerochaeta sp.]|nr:hypothetical protein [Sphaerochaeta sp.]